MTRPWASRDRARPRLRCLLFCRAVLAAVLAGGVALSRKQRRGRVPHILGQLPLAGQQLPGQVVGVRQELIRLWQPVGERQLQLRQLRRGRPDRVGPAFDGADDDFLALEDGLLAPADGLYDLGLDFLADVAGLGHFSSCGLANYIKRADWFVKLRTAYRRRAPDLPKRLLCRMVSRYARCVSMHDASCAPYSLG